jgi:predicted DsbA family dithiol-disulfide isomerase
MKARSFLANSRPAHEASEFAREGGRFEPFHRAVFRAYFEEGENIGDVDVLCRLADACGLDGAALREALAGGRYAHDVDEKVAWARQRGVAGVPTFIFPTRSGESAAGKDASATRGDDSFDLVGGQEYRVFESVAERLGARRR